MEFIPGTDLLTSVRGGADSPNVVNPLGDTELQVRTLACDEPRLRAVLRQLAAAVAAVHAAGKVHRDIKPSNVMVRETGRVVLLDFGLLEDANDVSSSSGRIVGSAPYMAPEQARAGDVSAAADWYSVGVVLFQALTGSLPHTGRTRYELMLRKQKYAAAPPRQFVPSVLRISMRCAPTCFSGSRRTVPHPARFSIASVSRTPGGSGI